MEVVHFSFNFVAIWQLNHTVSYTRSQPPLYIYLSHAFLSYLVHIITSSYSLTHQPSYKALVVPGVCGHRGSARDLAHAHRTPCNYDLSNASCRVQSLFRYLSRYSIFYSHLIPAGRPGNARQQRVLTVPAATAKSFASCKISVLFSRPSAGIFMHWTLSACEQH